MHEVSTKILQKMFVLNKTYLWETIRQSELGVYESCNDCNGLQRENVKSSLSIEEGVNITHILNVCVTQPIPRHQSSRECSLSSILFAIVTHSILTMLDSLVREGVFVGLSLPWVEPYVVQALVDDHIMFLDDNHIKLISHGSVKMIYHCLRIEC